MSLSTSPRPHKTSCPYSFSRFEALLDPAGLSVSAMPSSTPQPCAHLFSSLPFTDRSHHHHHGDSERHCFSCQDHRERDHDRERPDRGDRNRDPMDHERGRYRRRTPALRERTPTRVLDTSLLDARTGRVVWTLGKDGEEADDGHHGAFICSLTRISQDVYSNSSSLSFFPSFSGVLGWASEHPSPKPLHLLRHALCKSSKAAKSAPREWRTGRKSQRSAVLMNNQKKTAQKSPRPWAWRFETVRGLTLSNSEERRRKREMWWSWSVRRRRSGCRPRERSCVRARAFVHRIHS
jgi:hypothetical protein